jgi:hypothetical protein
LVQGSVYRAGGDSRCCAAAGAVDVYWEEIEVKMVTVKNRIAAYLEPAIEEKLRQYQQASGLNDSEVVNAIFAEFFSVSNLRKIIREEIKTYMENHND